MEQDDRKTIVVCVKARSLQMRLEASLAENGYASAVVKGYAEAVASLREGPRGGLICEIRRDEFAALLKSVVRLHPSMPVHLIDHRAVFAFYPLMRQPFDLIDAVMAAGVVISPDLLRHTTGDRRSVPVPDATFMV
jgi:hypothetical protein